MTIYLALACHVTFSKAEYKIQLVRPGYTTFFYFRLYDEEEKWRNLALLNDYNIITSQCDDNDDDD